MSRLDELRRVAGLVGIATRHTDALGVVHEPNEETLARLIAAFGLPADPQQAADALAAEGNGAPFGLVAPIVHEEDPAPALHLRLPPGQADAEWHCRFETGGGHAGRSDGAVLRLPAAMPLGYHRLALVAGATSAEIGLIVAPSSCHLPPGLMPGARSWGLTTQLYGLRSARDWGIGDFTDLAVLCRDSAALGATTVGINPLHALFAAEPRHFSPYSPSSRAWLNYLYIDVTAVPGFAEDAAAQALAPAAAIAAARGAEFVDYAAVAAVKRPVLEGLFRRFRQHAGGELAAAFRGFRDEGGEALGAFAAFEALHEHVIASGGPFSWHGWPLALRNPRSPAVGAFVEANAERVLFFQFLQWMADRQLARAADAGLTIGLYRDLAVGVNPNGADSWADRELVVPGAAIGAPPDVLNRAGQDWGLAPINPRALRRRSYAPLIAALRANMRHAGILRIDHVMGLQRLYWIPSGSPATQGAYINYPFDDLLRLVALESRRQGCAVVGEDLGTVPEGFRERLQGARVLSYRVAMFERSHDGSFVPPADYPPLAAASAATHDLATLKGFWLGRDIAWRSALGLYPDAAAAATEAAERRRDRRLLLAALGGEGLLTAGRFGEFLPDDAAPVYTPELGQALLAYLARSRARLMLVQLEDVAGEAEQANLPGTTDAHPNWRRRLPMALDALLVAPATTRLLALIADERRRAAAERSTSGLRHCARNDDERIVVARSAATKQSRRIMDTGKPARFHYRLGLNQPAASPTARRLAEMAAAILQESDGEFRLDVFPESRLGPDPQMFADLRRGSLEFYLSGALLGGVAPTSALPLLPFAFRDSAAVFALLDGALGDLIRGELAVAGLHAFRRSLQNGFHHITTDVRPIATAGDFAGLKIRTPGGEIAADFFRTLGAEPGMVPFSGMYEALRTKTFDGQSDPLGVVQSLRLHAVQRYLSLTSHWWTGFTLLANAASWLALPAAIQAVVERNTDEYALLQRADIEAVNAAGVEALKDAGMLVNAADTHSIQAALGAFYERWRIRFDPAAWALLEAALG
jgi:4-alpha-glucanotransferase